MSDSAGTSNEPVAVAAVGVIDQFKEVCDVDTVIAHNYLEESNWDLEAAIHLYFHSNDPEAIENQDNQMQELRRRQAQRTVNDSRVLPASGNNDTVRAQPQVVAVGGWLQWVRSFFAAPVQFLYSSVTKVFLFLYVLLFNPNTAIDRRRQRRIVNDERVQDAERFERNHQNSQLMREQEQEYARSLAADKAKRDQLRQAELQRKEEQKRARDAAQEIENKKLRLEGKRAEAKSQLVEEPNAGNYVICKIKFPGGQEFTRKFSADCSLEELFKAVLVHEKCPDNFSLLTGYPADVLNCAPEWYREFAPHAVQDPSNIPKFADSILEKRAVILVRNNDA